MIALVQPAILLESAEDSICAIYDLALDNTRKSTSSLANAKRVKLSIATRRLIYRYLKPAEVLEKVARLSKRERQAHSELLNAMMTP